MRPLVADASVVAKCFLPESGSAVAVQLVEAARPLLAPELVYYECTNVIWKAVRRGLTSQSGALISLGDLISMSIQVVDATQLMPTALSIALAHGHPVYDCYYLAAAIQNDADLATADERLYDLAQRVGLGERAILVR